MRDWTALQRAATGYGWGGFAAVTGAHVLCRSDGAVR